MNLPAPFQTEYQLALSHLGEVQDHTRDRIVGLRHRLEVLLVPAKVVSKAPGTTGESSSRSPRKYQSRKYLHTSPLCSGLGNSDGEELKAPGDERLIQKEPFGGRGGCVAR